MPILKDEDGRRVLTEALRVGQFAIVDHEPVDRGPNAGVFHGRGPHDDRAELFVVAEGTTPAGEAFAGHVVSALGHAFASLDMSLTGALRRLFLEAEQNVRDWNNRSIAQHRVSLGMSCFARRGGQTVVAQAGPTIAFHLSGRRVTTYVPEGEHARPIGGGASVPQLTRIPFETGDRLLMVSTAASGELDDEIIGGILALPGDQVLADLYHRVSHLRHLTAVLVTTAEPAAQSHEPSRGRGREPEEIIDATRPQGGGHEDDQPGDAYQPSLFIEDDGADAIETVRRQLLELRPRRRVEAEIPALVASAPVPFRRASGDSRLAMLVAESEARAAQSRALLNSVAAIPIARPSRRSGGAAVAEPATAVPDERRRQRRDSFSRGLVREETPPPPSTVVDPAPRCDELAADTRARATVVSSGPLAATIAGQSAAGVGSGGSLVRMRGDMGGRWKGTGGGGASVTVSQFPPTWLVIIVGLSLLVALVGLLVVPRALESDEGDHYAELVDGAQQQLAAARALPDLAKRREALTAAHAMLLEAQEVDGAALANTGLLQDVESELGKMDSVRTPQLVETVASLEQFGDKPVSVTRLAVSDTEAFLLNNSANQVIAVSLATGEKRVVFEESKEAKRGHPVSLAFMEQTEFAGAALIIADTNKNLWAQGEGGLQPLAFAAPQNLTITDLAAHNGDLYVLDAQAAVIYRFAQTSQGFASAPVKVLDTPDLAAARRLMVDGEIVTADANGTLRRFTNQLALVLSQAGIDRPLVKDELVQPVQARGDLAVLDAPGERVVVFRRDGTFDRQYKHKDLRAMTAFAMRDTTAYLFANGKLLRITW